MLRTPGRHVHSHGTGPYIPGPQPTIVTPTVPPGIMHKASRGEFSQQDVSNE